MPFQLDEKFILQTEEKIGVKFPMSFREKMIKENGGEIETDEDVWTLYPFFDNSDKKRIKRTINDIIRETEQARSWEDFPKEVVAIGSNGGGDQLVFIIQSDNPIQLDNKVYWWDHETGDLNAVADDFAELI